MPFFLSHVKERTVWRSKWAAQGGEKLDQAASGTLAQRVNEALSLGTALLSLPVSTYNPHPTVAERVTVQLLVGKGIFIKTEFLFTHIHLNYSSSGEYTGERSWAVSEKGTAKTSLDKKQLSYWLTLVQSRCETGAFNEFRRWHSFFFKNSVRAVSGSLVMSIFRKAEKWRWQDWQHRLPLCCWPSELAGSGTLRGFVLT